MKTAGQIDRDWRYFGVVLPINILSFGATPQNNTILLNWMISTPIPIDHVEIERSTASNNFNLIGTVNDIIKLHEEQHFGFTDDISSIAATEVLYYRLKFVGKGGEIKYSNVVLVKRNQATLTVTVMPNPATGYAAVRFVVQKEGKVAVRLMDMSGQAVLVQNNNVVKGTNTIMLNNLSRYSAGIYTLQLLINEEQVIQKLIIAK